MSRELKQEIVNLKEIGLYQSPSFKSSNNTEKKGLGQYLDSDLEFKYARGSIEPRKLESHFNRLVESNISDDLGSDSYLMNSGMGALSSTISLIDFKKPDATYYVNEGQYYENKNLYKYLSLSHGDSHEKDRKVKYMDTEETPYSLADVSQEEIKEIDPEVFILEYPSNSVREAAVDLEEIFSMDTQNDTRYIVLDYTSVGTDKDFSNLTAKLNDEDVLFLVTSLQKMYQGGDDLARGGMVSIVSNWFKKKDNLGRKLETINEIYGTNISANDLTSYFPISIENLKNYSRRIKENVNKLAANLRSSFKIKESSFIKKITVHEDGEDQAFLRVKFENTSLQNKFLTEFPKSIDDENLSVFEGNSFGFRDTRIAKGQPKAVRISPGKENIRQIHQLGNKLEKVLNRLNS